MARNEAHIDAPPEVVWEVLADPDSYGEWVVGSSHIRDADPDWPRPGTVFHHTVGTGPLKVNDHTRAMESDPPRRLVLRANARPVGVAKVEMLLEPDGDGTRVTMIEDLVGRTAPLRFLPTVQALTRSRNTESLRRLKRLAEERQLIDAAHASGLGGGTAAQARATSRASSQRS